ncbi:hypothetical protein CCYA_CCYA01G0399 [Cyanidiococcus yangmingshanensis]|nr:hypothetical protein CCYA_CCYA01G0399 [Cyanidiococcus yangmingshanensis]
MWWRALASALWRPFVVQRGYRRFATLSTLRCAPWLPPSKLCSRSPPSWIGGISIIFGQARLSTGVDGDTSTLERLREKYASLEKARIELDEKEVEETFVKGGGPGGQKVNKTSSCVILRHIPTGLVVRCQAFRSQFQNRQEARRILARKLDMRLRGEASQVAQEIARIRARKRKRRQKVVKKYFKSRADRVRLDT